MRNWFRRFFIPSEENGYAPHALQKLSAGLMLFLVLASFAVANIQTLFLLGSDWFVSTILPGVLVDLTNENRESDDLSHLVRNPLLDEAASRKAEDMARENYFAHYGPDGRAPWDWFDEVGYRYVHAGENLAVHFTESSEVVEGWMNSPGHRANILNENYTEIGIGTAEGEYKGFPTVYVVQLFGTPATIAAADPQPASEIQAAQEAQEASETQESQTAQEEVQEPSAVNEAVVVEDEVDATEIEEDQEQESETETDEDTNALAVAGETTDTTSEDEEASLAAEADESSVDQSAEQQAAGQETGDVAATEADAAAQTDDTAVEAEEAEQSDETKEAEQVEEVEAPAFAVTPDNTLVLYSDIATTTSAWGYYQGPGVSSGTTPLYTTPQVNGFLRVATEPTAWLSILYILLGSVILVALILSIVIEWRRQHPVQIAYGMGLVALLFIMFNVHEFLVAGVLIL